MTYFYEPQRASSIKTRIKTLIACTIVVRCDPLREHLPLKQGLRHYVPFLGEYFPEPQRASSIKTRIKTLLHYLFASSYNTTQRASSIKTRIKTFMERTPRSINDAQRASSIKTRIKTFLQFWTLLIRSSESIFH